MDYSLEYKEIGYYKKYFLIFCCCLHQVRQVTPFITSNEIRQIVYSLHQLKEIIKKAYKNIIKSIQISVNTIFINSENSKTSSTYVIIITSSTFLKYKTCEEVKEMLLYQILAFTIHAKT